MLRSRVGTAGRADGSHDLLAAYRSDPEGFRLLVGYMARAIQEDVPAAGVFVETMVAETEAIFRAGAAEGTMRRSSDPRALAVLSDLMSLAVLTMAPPVARALGHEDFGPDVLRRMTLPALELYTHGLYIDDGAMSQAAQDAWSAAERPSHQQKD